MSIAELKLKIFRQIDGLDKANLEEAYGILLNYLNSKEDIDEWANLTADQKKSIIEGIEQIENNEGIAHKQVMQKCKNKYNA
ncbi:hypothetical protein CYCD_11190 [Tenuifilaceae bacterium CYCD]|nr:hypothetical protein CYCD_11190 [Tenuifilaceae bacterium CYCD]